MFRPASDGFVKAAPKTENPFANLLCDLSPYNLPQLRDAEAKYYERIEIAKVEP